jgi:Putative prokaryotic signal transducing protein
MHKVGFVRLMTIGDPSEAQITAARLRAAGIEVRLHGENFGPYPITVGELADTEIWVPADRVDDAADVVAG